MNWTSHFATRHLITVASDDLVGQVEKEVHTVIVA